LIFETYFSKFLIKIFFTKFLSFLFFHCFCVKRSFAIFRAPKNSLSSSFNFLGGSGVFTVIFHLFGTFFQDCYGSVFGRFSAGFGIFKVRLFSFIRNVL